VASKSTPTTGFVPITRTSRSKARWKIIQEANKHKMRSRMGWWVQPTLLGMKDLQWAVFIVKRFGLVKDDVLVTAGFNPKRKR
jgi:hypothetical protein